MAEDKIERAKLIAGIEAEWRRHHPRNPLGLALLKLFGCNRLDGIATGYLRQIHAALA